MPNPLSELTFGGLLHQKDSNVYVTLHAAQTASIDEWLQQVTDKANQPAPMFAKTQEWWARFWGRSHFELGEKGQSVTTHYLSHRMMTAMTGRAKKLIKFNGFIFSAYRPTGGLGTMDLPNSTSYTYVDYRFYGSRSWWSNTVKAYWGMLAGGDYDLLRTSLFDCYVNHLPIRHAETKHYFNISNAVFWHEYVDCLFGTQHPRMYRGCGSEDAGAPVWWSSPDRYNNLDYTGNLHLSQLIVDYFLHTQDDTYLFIVAEVLEFFHQRFPVQQSTGKIKLFPTQAIESCECNQGRYEGVSEENCAVNDQPTLAGLHFVLEAILLTSYGTPTQRTQWHDMKEKLPELPVRNGSLVSVGKNDYSDRSCGQPAGTLNAAPAHYAIQPFRLYSVGRGNAHRPEVVNSWNRRSTPLCRTNSGLAWCGDVVASTLGYGHRNQSAQRRAEHTQRPGGPGQGTSHGKCCSLAGPSRAATRGTGAPTRGVLGRGSGGGGHSTHLVTLRHNGRAVGGSERQPFSLPAPIRSSRSIKSLR